MHSSEGGEDFGPSRPLSLTDTSYTSQPELKDRYKSHCGYTISVISQGATCRSRPIADFTYQFSL